MELIDFDLKNEDHVVFMYESRRAPEVVKNLFGKPPSSFEQHVNWLSTQKGIRNIFIIMNNFRMIGYCQIYNIRDNMVEVGWVIHPHYQFKGYGLQAVKILVLKCRQLYPGKDIELFVKNDNIPALILYLKSDFLLKAVNDDIVHMERKNVVK